MASVFDEVRAERAALLRTIEGLQPEVLERPGVVGEWSARDVLAHIAGWQSWMLRALPARLDGTDPPEDLRVTARNTHDWNRRFVEERRTATTAALLDEITDGLRRILTLAANLGSTRLTAPDPWPGREASFADYLREHLADHDREHREQIARALAER